tara:strand:+ start:871 stop:1053 length:183 start_codon:yes stop_codon:yes gene_type:complete
MYWCGIAQLVEQTAVNRQVAGSSPASAGPAALAQLVEQLICNHQVVSSSLTGDSKYKRYK